MGNSANRKLILVLTLAILFVFAGIIILFLSDSSHADLAPFDKKFVENTITDEDSDGLKESSKITAEPNQSEPKTWVDKLELPVPQETLALARYYGTIGRRNFSDAQVIWQKRADRYIDFLKKESFSQGTYRSYMKSELIQVMGETFNSSPYNNEIIRLLCRTRRLNKLIDHVNRAETPRELNVVIKELEATVNRFMKEESEIEDKLEKLAKEEPEIFQPYTPGRRRFTVLARGYALSGLDVDERGIPMSLDGAAHGLAANSFLLGLTESPHAVESLLKIAGYDNIEFQKKIKAVMDNDNFKKEIIYPNSLANFIVIGDALDRILVSCAGEQKSNLSTSAKTIAKEYIKWRAEHDFPEREVIEVYPWDAPQTPYHLPGYITGQGTKVETINVTLPLTLADKDKRNRYERGLNPVMNDILNWAGHFQAALDEN